MSKLIAILVPSLLFAACSTPPEINGQYSTPLQAKAKLTRWIAGSAADVSTSTTGGTVLMGGGTDVDAAIQWMIQKSGGGDFVIIRASGADGYNSYIYNDLGGVNSCETILIDSRNAANDPGVETTIRNAEAVFMARRTLPNGAYRANRSTGIEAVWRCRPTK